MARTKEIAFAGMALGHLLFAATIAILGITFYRWYGRAGARARISAAAGALLTAAMIYLGAIWPSLFTIAALLVVPAFVALLVGLLRPAPLHGPRLRVYLHVAVALSLLGLAIEAWWLLPV